MLNDNSARFTPWGGDAYANDIYRGAVDAIARNAAKLKGQHVVTAEGLRKPGNDQKLNKLLQVAPNPYMSAYDMLYKLTTHYYLYNNAFAVIQYDDNGNAMGIYPINAAGAEFLTDERGTLYIRFRFRTGNTATFLYNEVIHLRRNFNSDELLGDDNRAIDPAIELAHTQNEGIINGIKSSANIRGILKFTQILAPEKLDEERQKFIDSYLTVSNNGGVVVTDPKTSYEPIEAKPATIDADQLKATKEKVYDYLGISESIVNSTYTEDIYAAFYESVLEPLAVQLSLEFTRKLFTAREQAFGNSVMFESSRLQFSSNTTKINLVAQLMPYGLLTVNQALEVLNLPPVKDGDKRLQTLNVVDAAKANKYQVGEDGQSHTTDKDTNGQSIQSPQTDKATKKQEG